MGKSIELPTPLVENFAEQQRLVVLDKDADLTANIAASLVRRYLGEIKGRPGKLVRGIILSEPSIVGDNNVFQSINGCSVVGIVNVGSLPSYDELLKLYGTIIGRALDNNAAVVIAGMLQTSTDALCRRFGTPTWLRLAPKVWDHATSRFVEVQ